MLYKGAATMIFEKPEVIGAVDDAICEQFHTSLPYIDERRRDATCTVDISKWGLDIKQGNSHESRRFVDEFASLLDASGVIARASLISIVAIRKKLATGEFTIVPSWHRDGLRVVLSRGANTEFLVGDIPVVTEGDDVIGAINSSNFASVEPTYIYAPQDNEAVMFDIRHWHRSAKNTAEAEIDRLFVSAYVSLPAADKMISF